MSRKLLFATLTLTLGLMLPMSAAAAERGFHEGTRTLSDGTVVTLERVSGISAMAGGTWNAGCRYSATNALGNTIYSFTIWQKFTSDGSKITTLFNETTSSFSDLGWSLTSSSSSNGWNNAGHTSAWARGNYKFTQYVSGVPYRTASGWVEVDVSANGTWNCTSS